MAEFARTNGNALSMEQVGRDLFFKTFSKTDITQAELNALVEVLGQTVTITAIGAFTAGTSDAVNMIVEGADVASPVSAGGASFTVTNMTF
jgi:hypothetical protein